MGFRGGSISEVICTGLTEGVSGHTFLVSKKCGGNLAEKQNFDSVDRDAGRPGGLNW